MHYVITGGAGFIGSNLAHHLIGRGEEVTVFDDLSRKGTERNLEWLRAEHGERLRFVCGDVRDYAALAPVIAPADVVYHLAAQVAVTTSVSDPRPDFEVNALGAFNALEAARAGGRQPVFIFTSTNKVYGGMDDVVIVEEQGRYRYRDYPRGVDESRTLDFHSPYGCSKGAADQYVHDYARIYGIRSVVFRMSCIYGPRQFGNEDQGWVAHFVIATLLGRPLSIYGDGKQVRDILFVDELVRAFDMATEHIAVTAGQVYNIGGGADNTISIWTEFGPLLEELFGRLPEVTYGDWRPGDQKVYVSDVAKAGREFGWRPTIDRVEGVRRLAEWVRQNRTLFG
jgi:CDP-paratose 2-epimerase